MTAAERKVREIEQALGDAEKALGWQDEWEGPAHFVGALVECIQNLQASVANLAGELEMFASERNWKIREVPSEGVLLTEWAWTLAVNPAASARATLSHLSLTSQTGE